MDPRMSKLAKVLVQYSLQLKEGQLVRIVGEPATIPLIQAVYEEALKVGAHPYSTVKIPECEESLYKLGSDDQVRYMLPWGKAEVKTIDAYVGLWGSTNTRYLSGVDPKKQALARQAARPLWEIFQKRELAGNLKWVGTLFPTPANAQDADMSLADYEDFVYGAGHIDASDPVKHWQKIHKEQARLCSILDRVDQIHVLAEDTDLRLRVKGRKWINCAGENNFPDGEVFTGPIENTVEGHIRFTFPAVYMGRLVEDVRLEFKKGKVVRETAGKNQAFLTAMLDQDKGARFVGEFAIGTNYDIQRFTKNILFDEKIGGTCHMAVGNSILESGGKNKSGLHWDMICDLKKGGEITADGKVVYRNGKFTI